MFIEQRKASRWNTRMCSLITTFGAALSHSQLAGEYRNTLHSWMDKTVKDLQVNHGD